MNVDSSGNLSLPSAGNKASLAHDAQSIAQQTFVLEKIKLETDQVERTERQKSSLYLVAKHF
ncbi:hypothetical protein JCM17795_10760 [Galenea microaerophila]